MVNRFHEMKAVSKECDRAGRDFFFSKSRTGKTYDVVANKGKVLHVFIILWVTLERISDRYAVIETKKSNN